MSALYCLACEAATLEPTSLGFIGDDGGVGELDGFACAACGWLGEASGARLVITGRVELGGRRAFDVLMERLRELGCHPKERR